LEYPFKDPEKPDIPSRRKIMEDVYKRMSDISTVDEPVALIISFLPILT
jgi:hypothetical protein